MKNSNQPSFLPKDYLANKQRRRTNIICTSLLAIVITAIAAAMLLSQRSLRHIEARHKQIEAQYTEAAKRIDQVKKLEQIQQAMSQQAQLAASLLEKVPRSNLLAEITNDLPAGVSLIDLTMSSKARPTPRPVVTKTPLEQKKEAKEKKNAPPEPKLYDVSIKLSGVAADDVQVAQFIRNLSGSKLLQDVNLVVVQQAKMNGDEVRKFVLDMMINPAADLQADTPLHRQASLDVHGRL